MVVETDIRKDVCSNRLDTFFNGSSTGAQEQVLADNPSADKVAPAPLSLQQKTDAVQVRLNKIRGRVALLPSEEAGAPPEAMAGEWTQYKRLLNQLVNTTRAISIL